MHVALARKYRPRLFAELIGQEHIARALRGAIEQGRVAHGYLLCGPRGVGKTTAARVLAMSLNCDTRHAGTATSGPGEPCGSCVSCARIWSGSASLDVVEIDAASNRGVEDARDLRERAMYAASQEGRHKVYIVDEAHMLTREAWNTLLKVLEEPPPGVVFVFATTEPHKITNNAAPVMSRLQRFDFRRVGPEAIGKRLADVASSEGLAVEPDAIEVIARRADGGLRDALSVLDQVTAFGGGAITAARVRNVLGLVSDEVYAELLDIVAQRRAGAVFPFVAALVEAGVDLIAFAEGAGDLWRAALAVKLGAKPDGISSALAETVRARADELAAGDLLRILRGLEDAEEPIKRGQAPRLSFETLLVRWALMDRTVEIAELITGGLGDRGTGGLKDRGAVAVPAKPDRLSPAPVVRDVAPPGRAPAPAMRASESVRIPVVSAASTPSVPTSPSAPVPQSPGPPVSLSADAVRRAWPAILDALRSDRKMIAAELLSETEVAAVDGGVVILKPQAGHDLAADSIDRYRGAIEAAASRVLGAALQVGLVGEELRGAAPAAPAVPAVPAARAAVGRNRPAASPTRAAAPEEGPPENAPLPEAAESPARPVSSPPERRLERVTVSGARAERAKALRGKDPALDSAMDAMDLELLD